MKILKKSISAVAFFAITMGVQAQDIALNIEDDPPSKFESIKAFNQYMSEVDVKTMDQETQKQLAETYNKLVDQMDEKHHMVNGQKKPLQNPTSYYSESCYVEPQPVSAHSDHL